MVSTNAAGARSVRYGSVRRWVEALTLVTAEGESVKLARGESGAAGSAGLRAVERFQSDAAPRIQAASKLITDRFPKTRKNSSGYALDAYLASGDVLDLIIGAEGTLGIVTEIEWRLDDVPAFRAGLRVHLSSLAHLGDVVGALNQCEPSALELLDRSFLDLLGEDRLSGAGLGSGTEAIVLVELERTTPRPAVGLSAAPPMRLRGGPPRSTRPTRRPRRSSSGRSATRRAPSWPGFPRIGARSR